jgi:hypothetical protein
LLVVADGSDPNRDTVSKELAGSSGTSALDVWSTSVVFQTGTWAGEILSAAVSSLASVGKE